MENNRDSLRVDGRRPLELRQINVRLGVFGQADGSAYLEQGKTSVLAAVYGPRQPRGASARKSTKAIVNCQFSMAVFCATERKSRPRGDRKTQETSIQLRHAMEAILNLDQFPRSQIDIFVEVLQSDGSNYCVAVNAATLALVDAGIPIKDYAIGCTVALVNDDNDDSGVLDVNTLEENGSSITLSIVASDEIMVAAQGSGKRLHLSSLEAMKTRALNGCQSIKTILDQSVRDHLTLKLL